MIKHLEKNTHEIEKNNISIEMIIKTLKELRGEKYLSKEQIEKNISKTPKEIKEMAEEHLLRLEKLASVSYPSEDARKVALIETIEVLEKQYIDPRFEEKTINDKQLELVIGNIIDGVVETERLDTEGKIKLIVFDVNGLKAVNDNFGREVGDWYLKEIRNIIAKSTVIENYKSDGSEAHFASANGGDEFFLLLVGDKDINTKHIINGLRREIATIDCKEKMSQEDNIIFAASASIGEVDFSEGLTAISQDEFDNLDYEDIVKKMISSLFSKGHSRSHADKKEFMELLKNGSVDYLNIAQEDQKKLRETLLRNEESAEQSSEIEILKKKNDILRRRVEELEKLLRTKSNEQ